MPPRIRLFALGAALALALAAAGCGSSHHSVLSPGDAGRAATDAAAPEPGCAYGPRDFYPLAIGNRWHYRRTFMVTVVDSLGRVVASGSPFQSTIVRQQVCQQDFGARRYLIERVTETAVTDDGEGDRSWRSWIWFRQGREGLFEADTSGRPECEADGKDEGLIGGPTDARRTAEEGAEQYAMDALTAAVPGGTRAAYATAWQCVRDRVALLRSGLHGSAASLRHPGPRVPPAGELLRLRYPLVPGQSWLIRLDPRFAARVERLDALRLAPGTMPGWRIRYTSEMFGPHDVVHVWYGRQGFLKLAYHLESPATDSNGRFLGTAIADEVQVLDSLSLVRPSLLADAAGEQP